jgi:hypothetical protein
MQKPSPVLEVKAARPPGASRLAYFRPFARQEVGSRGMSGSKGDPRCGAPSRRRRRQSADRRRARYLAR